MTDFDMSVGTYILMYYKVAIMLMYRSNRKL